MQDLPAPEPKSGASLTNGEQLSTDDNNYFYDEKPTPPRNANIYYKKMMCCGPSRLESTT